MPDIEVTLTGNAEFEVFCSCGEGLCGQTRTSFRRGMPQVVVEPCDKCMQRAKDEGFDEGYADGQNES